MSIISDYWFSSQAGGPGPGPDPFIIGDSLRFRGQQFLINNSLGRPAGEFTLSFWMKTTLTQADGAGLYCANTGTNDGYNLSHVDARIRSRTGGGFTDPITKPLRDPSAWYHICIQSDGSGVTTCFVNSRQQMPTVFTFPNSGVTIIGAANSNVPDEPFQGYLADFFCIDGQILGPGVFAGFNAQGVWAPFETPDFDGNFGADGYHLDFSDPFDLGADRSGNGNNFVPNNFNTELVGIFSNALTTNTSFSNADPRTNVFDGNEGTVCDAVGQAGVTTRITFAPTTPLVLLQLEVFNGVLADQQSIFGGTTTQNLPTSQWVNIPLGTATELSVDSPLVIERQQQSGSVQIAAIRINGTIVLKDNRGDDFDIMQDSPSQNFSTWNKLVEASTGTTNSPSEGNLTLRGAAGITICEKPPGQTIYFEVNAGFVNNGRTWSNWWNVIQILNGQCQDISGGGNNVAPQSMLTNGGFAFDITANVFANNIDEQVEISSANLVADDIIGVQIDDDNITIFINGVESSGVNNRAFVNDFPDGMYIYARNASSAGSTAEYLHVNFGQRPFLFFPDSLGGHDILNTQNMPAATIVNGRDHFAPATYQGTGSEVDLIGSLFQPDLAWIKGRDNDTNHVLVDSVRGAELVLESNEAFAEVSDPESVKLFLANGVRLGTSNDVNNGTAGVNKYVAFLWRAGGAAVANNDGTRPSQVSANRTAGFSIVSYTGNSTLGATVGHGLNRPIDFMLVKNRENGAAKWNVYHRSLGGTKFLHLNTPDKAVASIDRWNNMDPSDTVINLGDSSETNAAQNMIAYCWHGVRGYSEFGSFQSNGFADGPFVALPFKPAWVMLKWSDNNSRWDIFDSSRNVDNPTDEVLQANEPATGNTGLFTIDTLANGFKVRDSGGLNVDNNTLIYAAFAEHPTGGINVSPATAR